MALPCGRLQSFAEYAIGSVARPMTDTGLESEI
jgi:hypothetical protein